MEVPNFRKNRLSQLIAHGLTISGRGGSKGGGGSRTPVEANDTVNSRAMASVLDLLGEGVIGGLVDGAKSIFLNDTPLQNSDNSYNFSGVTWWFRDGSQDQSVIDGFDFIETPKSVGRQLKQTSQVNVSLDSADSDRVRVVMKFPSLRSINKKSGDTNGTTVQFKFQIDAGNGKGFVDVVAEGESSATISLTAKKTGVYYRSYVIDLPKPAKSYTLRAIRLTEDHTDNSYLYDDTYVDSIGEIVNTSLNYPNSALVGLKINSEQFGSTMPSRSYLIKGLKIRVPSNYNADTNTYNGNWDGTFKLASSSNPAWILFDLLTNTRYGLGQFVQESMINIGELYQIGRYCDAYVDDGFGGKEKRFSINTQITSRQDAYRVVQDIAGAFRGMVYWAGGMVHVTQDSPADPVMLFSNSNVVNGSFAYKGSARKDRYSVALVTYNNKEDGYKQSVEYVEDQEAIKRYGIRKTESVAFGCTSRGQAHRVGLWILYTSRMESDVITFAVGMDSIFLMPGDVVLIADKFRAGRRNSGRITGYTSNSIKLDAPVDLTSVGNHITFLSAEGKMVERDILENGKNITTVTFKTALSSNETPVNDAVWVIAQPDLTPMQARVVSVTEGEDGTSFNITAIQNNPTKYEAIDSGAQLIPQNTTVLDPTFSKPSGLTITEGTYLSSPGNLSVSLTATWQGKSAQYYISWRRSDAGNVSNWKSERVTEEQFELRGVAENGQYDFQVYAVSVGGRKTDPISITYKVLGTMTAPDAPTGLTAVGDYRSIVLNWVNPASVDLDHIEVLASKTNDKSKAQLIAKVSGTTFSHNGLEDSVTWYYWVRAANKRGMLSPLNSPLATTATTRDVLSFLKNKITESELGQSLIADIDSKAVATEVDAAIEDAKSQATNQINDARAEAANAIGQAQKTLDASIKQEAADRKNAVAEEASARAKAVAEEASARAKAVAEEASARAKAVADEASARAKAVADEASARASAISDSVAFEANARAKAISDSASTLSAKIDKEASDRAAAVSALDTKTANALSSETSNRIAAISNEAKARADAILQEQNNRKADISTLKTQVQTSTDSLAQQISQVAAGTGEQFDSLKIWYFDTSNEGWTEDDNGNTPMSVTSDGWLKSVNSTASCRSPNNMAIDAAAYRFVKLRLKKVGSPVWAGKVFWIGASESGWSDARSLTINEPEYDVNGVATLTIHDIDWRSSETIRRFRFDFLKNQDSKNYVQIDWIAVGRPTPGAGMAALQAEQTARTNADAAEAANRNTLAVQIRGSYEGNDLSKVSSGLIFQEQQARVTADRAEATARQSLETKVNDSVSSINRSLDTLNTQDKAMASDISGLKSSLGNKADASAVQTLKTMVDQQGSNISTQGQSITKLQNDLNTTNINVGKKADQTALVSLQGTVTQQGKDITSANSSITNLKTSLDATNSNLAKKADASAVGDLSSRVSATENKVSSQGDSIVQLNNSLSDALADSDASIKTPNNLIINPSFERGTDGYIGVSSLSTVVTIQIPHVGTKALKIDPGSSVSPGQYVDFVKDRTYEIGVWVKQVSGTTDNGQGNNKLRVGNSAGAPVLEIPFVNLTVDWTKVSKRWKATETGSLPVTLSNYLTTGNRYFDDFYVIDVTDSVAIDANASALSSLQNTVTQQGKDISSQSTSITSLNNSLKTTNDNVAKKADSSTVQTLQNTVTQQGKDISAVTSDISSLKNSLATTNGNVAKKADASALQSLQNTVTQQGKDLTSVGSRTTALENNLKATNDNVAKKADATALSTLQNTVTQQGKDIASQSGSITSLKNSVGSLVNMGDNLVQDANFDNGGQTFRTQQNSGTSGSVVEFGAFGENSPGVRMVKVNSTSPGLFANGKLPVPVNGARKYRYIVRAKGVSGAMNMLLRRWNFNGNTEGVYEDKNNTLTTDWQTITWDTSFSPKDGVDGQSFGIYCHPANAEIWIDSFQVFDITDAFNNDATASALSDLSSKVSQQGSTITSQSTAITKLQNDLSSTKTDVSKKADATALQTLQNTVTQQDKTLSSQANALTTLKNSLDAVKSDVSKKADATALNNLSTRVRNTEDKISSNSDAITSLNSSLNQQSKRGANILPDGTFESYSNGYNMSGGRVIITTDDSHGGNKCIRVTRPNDYNANATDNSDNHIFSGFQVRDNAVFYVECWIKLDTKSTKMDGATQIAIGMSLQYQDNSWQWPALIKSAKDLSTDAWTKVSGYLKSSKSGIKQAMVRISMPNVPSVKAGNSFLIDDLIITDVTDAYNAQQTADATASAVSTLQTTVSKQGDTLTSQGTKIDSLSNGLAIANKNIGTKADASALQTLQNVVTQQGKDIASQSDSVTKLSNALNNVSIGGVNLIKNSGDMTGWSGKTNEIFRGNAVISATVKAGSSYRDLKEIILDAPVDNAEYVYSFFAKGGENGQSMTAYFYNPNSTISSVSSQGVSGGDVDGRMSFTLTTEWVRYWVKWKQKPGTGSKRLILARIQASSTKDQTVSITSPKLEVGNMPTEWSPAPSDMASSNDLSSLKTTVDANSGAIQSVTSRVQKTEGSISTQNTAITKLQSDLSTTNKLVSTKADSAALQTLSGRVDKTESGISTQNDAITKLNSSLDTTNKAVAKKAEQSSLDTLSGRVSSTENGITAANSSITSLNAAIRAGNASSGDLITNPTFDPQYAQMGFTVVSTDTDGVPANCPFKYAAKLASRDHHPNFNTIAATLGDVFEISVMVACGAGNADFNLYIGTANGPTGGIGGPLYNGGNTKATSTWTRVTWKFTVSQAMVDKGYIRPFLQINQTSPFGTIWYVTDWHMRNITAASKAQDTANATSKAVDSLTSTVNQQGSNISSIGSRTTSLENGLKATNDNVSKKADSTTVQTLQNTVTQHGKDISAAGTNITSMQASLTRRTVFTVTARGNGSSANPGLFDESGKNLFTPGRSYGLVTFKTNSDGSTVINTSKTYDVFGSANNGKAMSDDIAALANGVYVCVMTYDEPTGQRSSIASALELLGGTTEVINSLPYRGAYILLGRKGMKAGDGLELRAPTGGDSSAFISTSVEFINGVMSGLGAAGGVMMKADANASAITTLKNTVTQQGKDITSASSAITNLQNGLNTANGNINKKADATALSALQNTVTQQGKDLSSQGASLTQLTNSLNATNDSIDASGQIPGNMITNASFERDNGGYSTWSGPVSVMVAQSPRTGKKILKIASGSPALVGQKITYVKGRTYKIGMWARQESNTTINGGTSNTKFRVADSAGLIASFGYGPFTTSWQEISWTWTATKDVVADTQITAYLNSGSMYFDDFYVIDITDRVDLDATSGALSSLTSRVTNVEGKVTSNSSSITTLNNTVSSLNKTVAAKADTSALQSLQNTVTQQGKDISSTSGSVTNLQSSLNTLKVQTNPWIDGTFETYDNNQQIGGSTAIITTNFKNSGNKCLKVTRPANSSGNSDKTIGSYSVVRQSAKYRVEFWAMMPAAEAPPSGWSVAVGLHSINKDGGNDWKGIVFNENGLGARDKWVKFTGVISLGESVTRSQVWISTRGQSGSNTPGYSVYIDDVVITDVTDAAEAQQTANANATAISSLQAKTSDLDGKITAQTNQLTSMQSKVDASSSKVDQLSKTISDSQSTQASLNTSLQSQIDAQASANIKNQADLNSAVTSIASIKSTQATQATQISAMAKTQTDMTASLNSQSATIQTLQEAVSNNDALNSTWMVKMETNNNGQKYAAGIALGVDGKNMQSQFLVQADRFALINTSNGNTTTPFVIDNGVTYMNAAFIKDGSIGSAKVGDLMSSNFQENVRGWRISRDGTMNINGSGPGSSRTVITNGKIEVYDSNNRLRVRMGIF